MIDSLQSEISNDRAFCDQKGTAKIDVHTCAEENFAIGLFRDSSVM